MPKPFNIEKFNRILKTYNQRTRAIKITTKVIELSNGVEITEKNKIIRCKKRVMGGFSSWKANFDLIYGLDEIKAKESEKYARSLTSSTGGLACQSMHGTRIAKENLTGTGVPFEPGHTSWNKGLTKYNNESLKRFSESRKGIGNPMYGTVMPAEEKARRSVLMKARIFAGEFTPNSNNRNTHWDSTFNGKKYRSSWEALYHYYNIDDEYEKLRIRYSFANNEYIYIVDFVNHNNKTATEVKPKELCHDDKTRAKLLALQAWCDDNRYTFILADKEYLSELGCPASMEHFDEKTKKKINKLYEVN